MKNYIYQTFILTLFMFILLGFVYPFIVTQIGQLFFHHKSNGSIITFENKKVGSSFIGQKFTLPQYFHGRPSNAGEGYDTMQSSGSNSALSEQKYYDTLKNRIATLLKKNPDKKSSDIPLDLITSSASGLDPHISIAAANFQLQRVARARQLSIEKIQNLINQHTQKPFLGLFGEPVVNVLELNLALNSLSK